MTLAHSSPPCSQMCRYSCPWTTPPCTSLSLLTWGCPCAAWRFSTNHWPLQRPASWPPQQLFHPNHYYFLFPTVPRPSTSCGTSCVWQVGVQTLVSLSLLRPPSSLHHDPPHTHTSPARLVRRQCIPAFFSVFLFQPVPPFACSFSPWLSRFCPLFFHLIVLIWWVADDDFIVMLFHYAPPFPLDH